MTKIMALGFAVLLLSTVASVTMPSPAVLAWDAARHSTANEVERIVTPPSSYDVTNPDGTVTHIEIEESTTIIYASR